MSENKVKTIYDQLAIYASTSRASHKEDNYLYPIHKKLILPHGDDLFDLILREIPIKKSSHVLDLGCGVGYGLLFYHKKLNCSGTGISISLKEIHLAKANAERLNAGSNCLFIQQSYDQAIDGLYDIILAVESLKHSPELKQTFQNIQKNLKPGGKLIIVEDFLQSSEDISLKHISGYQKFWALYQVYKESDYESQISLYPDLNFRYLNLSEYLVKRSSFSLWLLTTVSAMLKYLPINKFSKLAQVYLGGFYLENLYKSGNMAYKILLVEKS